MNYIENVLLLLTEPGRRMGDAFFTVVDDKHLVSNHSITTLIALRRDGTLRPAQIKDLTNLTSGGTTKLIQRMERGGLVRRDKGTVVDDGRAVVVSLTSAGATVAERIVAAEEPYLDALIDDLASLQKGDAEAPPGVPGE